MNDLLKDIRTRTATKGTIVQQRRKYTKHERRLMNSIYPYVDQAGTDENGTLTLNVNPSFERVLRKMKRSAETEADVIMRLLREAGFKKVKQVVLQPRSERPEQRVLTKYDQALILLGPYLDKGQRLPNDKVGVTIPRSIEKKLEIFCRRGEDLNDMLNRLHKEAELVGLVPQDRPKILDLVLDVKV